MLKKYIKISGKHALLCALIAVSTVIIDLVSKRIVMKNMYEGESVPLIRGILNLTFITNDGAAFGSFSNHRWVFMLLSSVLLAVTVVLVLVWDQRSRLFYVGASLVFGGGIGNMIDRIAYGTVVDFIDFCAFPKLWKWIFNFADSFVCVGCGILILYYLIVELGDARRMKTVDCEKEKSPEDGEETDENDHNG